MFAEGIHMHGKDLLFKDLQYFDEGKGDFVLFFPTMMVFIEKKGNERIYSEIKKRLGDGSIRIKKSKWKDAERYKDDPYYYLLHVFDPQKGETVVHELQKEHMNVLFTNRRFISVGDRYETPAERNVEEQIPFMEDRVVDGATYREIGDGWIRYDELKDLEVDVKEGACISLFYTYKDGSKGFIELINFEHLHERKKLINALLTDLMAMNAKK
jgi:hypothetical protein